MKIRLSIIILTLLFEYVQGQCDYIVPPSVKKIDYATRQFTFSNVTINGKRTTFMKLKKGAFVTIKTNVKAEKNGNYCPNCIVQLYWGIRGHVSTCVTSFGGYKLSSKQSVQKFRVPNKDGIYYVTMGGSLEYSCKNNVNRPECSPDYAIAVLKVGNPKPNKKVAIERVQRNNTEFLKTSLLSSGCFVNMDQVQWSFGGNKVPKYKGLKEIPLTRRGVYTATWSNCLDSASKSFPYKGKKASSLPQNENVQNEKEIIPSTPSRFGQCDYIVPPSIKKIDFAKRKLTFSDVTINGKRTTFMKVRKGEQLTIKTRVKSEKNGNYCPGCIVQVYWGIKGHNSTCTKSFGGYRFSSKKSSQKFRAPNKDGIYYVTMGGSLEYSCKNNVNRPECSADYAIAVLKVGNPNPDKKMLLEKVQRNSNDFLKTSLLHSGCFNINKVQWSFEGNKVAKYDNRKEIPLTDSGVYTATWFNCLDKISKSFTYRGKKTENLPQNTPSNDVSELIRTKDKFILENLIFDQGKAYIKPLAAKDLDQLAKSMLANPSLSILIEGHTDYRGGAKANLILSKKRVASVKKYLIRKGVSKKNLQTKGFGEQKPLIVDSDIKKCRINRRVEVTVLSR